MKKKSFAVLLCAGVLALALALVGCSEGSDQSDSKNAGYKLVNEGKLTVAASLDFPPFENFENGEPVGFSIELMRALAEEMGLEAEYLPSVKFDAIVPMIVAGSTADVSASSFTITEERKQEVDFTDPYCDSNQSVVVLKDSGYATVSDLQGKKIGVQSGSTGAEWAEENIANANLVPFDEMMAVFAALQSGQIDAIAADLPMTQYYIKNAYQDAEIIQEVPTGEQYGILVNKDNPELTKALNEALAAIRSNGKYEELEKKWFI